MKQNTMMRAMQNEQLQELHEIIEYMNERQERLMSTMECKQKLMGGSPRTLRKLVLRDEGLGRLDLGGGSGIAREVVKELFERREENQSAGAGETQLLLRGGVTQKAAAGSQSSKAEGDLSVSEVRHGGGSEILSPC